MLTFSTPFFATMLIVTPLNFSHHKVAHVKAERDILAEADNEWVVKLYYSFQVHFSTFFMFYHSFQARFMPTPFVILFSLDFIRSLHSQLSGPGQPLLCDGLYTWW